MQVEPGYRFRCHARERAQVRLRRMYPESFCGYQDCDMSGCLHGNVRAAVHCSGGDQIPHPAVPGAPPRTVETIALYHPGKRIVGCRAEVDLCHQEQRATAEFC